MVYVSRSTLQQSAARRAQSVADDQLKQLDDSIAQSKAQTEALAAPTSVAQPESAPAPSQPDASSGLPSIDDLMSEHGFSGASGSSVGIQQAQPQQEQSGFTLPTIDELMPQDLMPKREHPLVDAPESYSGALTAMGGTPEAESLTQPGGTAYVAPRATGGTGTPMAMPQARIPRDVSSGSYAPVTDDTTITKETVNQSAAAALARAGLPPSMAPYIAGIAINEGILQPGTIARDYWSVGGVKAPGSAGVITVPTREVINGESVMQMASFGKFNSMQEGMDALAEFIRDSPRFGPVARQAAETGDYSGMIEGFRQQGYATDPNWTRQVNSIASTLPDPVSSQPSQPQAGTIKGGLTVAEAQAADRGRTMAYQAPYASDESGIIYPGDEPLPGGLNGPNRGISPGYGDGLARGVRENGAEAGGIPQDAPSTTSINTQEPDGAYYSSPAGTRLTPPTAFTSTQPSDTVESAAPSPDVAPVSLGDRIKQTFSDFGSKLGELFGATNDAAVGALNQGGQALQQGAQTAGDVFARGRENPSPSQQVTNTILGEVGKIADTNRIGWQGLGSKVTGGIIPAPTEEEQQRAQDQALQIAQDWMLPTSAAPEVRGLAAGAEDAMKRMTVLQKGLQTALEAGDNVTADLLRGELRTVAERVGQGLPIPRGGNPAPAMGIVSRAQADDAARQYDRYYHGTGSDFARPEPGKFDPNGLFGPGYYVTSDARVAGGVIDDGGQVAGRGYGQNRARESVLAPEFEQMYQQDLDAARERLKSATDPKERYRQEEIIRELTNQLRSFDQPTGPNIRPVDVPRISTEPRPLSKPKRIPDFSETPDAASLRGNISAANDAVEQARIQFGYGSQEWQRAGRIADDARQEWKQARDAYIARNGEQQALRELKTKNLHVLDADIPISVEGARRIDAKLPEFMGLDGNGGQDWVHQGATGQDVYEDLLNLAKQQMGSEPGVGVPDFKTTVNEMLQAAGYDGIKYAGGKRIPMTDEAGNAIEHQALVIFPEALDKIRNATAGTPGGLLPGEASSGKLAGAVGRSVGTGVGAAYQESQNPESTPQSIIEAGARGAGMGLLNEGLRAGIGANGASRVMRAVQGYDPSQSSNPVLRDQGRMFERDVPNEPDSLPLMTRLAQAWTDDRAALSNLEKESADRIGRVLKPEDMPSMLTRVNPEAVAAQRLQESLKPAIQTVNDAGVGPKALEQHLVIKHNLDIGEMVRERATLKYLARDVPVMGEAAVVNAEKALSVAEKRLDDLTSAARTPAAVEHTAYGRMLDRAQAEAERLQEQASNIRQKQWEGQLGKSAKALQQAQDELDRLDALRGTAAEPEPAAYARMIKDAERRMESASGQFDRAQEVFANRIGQQETDMAERSLARAERYKAKIEAIQSNERDRLLKQADDALVRAQERVAKAYELRDMGVQDRIERALNIGDVAAETRAFSGGYTLADMRQALSALQEEVTAQYGPRGWQAIQDASDQIWKLNAETLQRKGQAGLLPEETVQALLQRYPHYVRTDIADWVKDALAGGTGPSRRLGVSGAPIQAITMKGTSKDRVNPLWSTVVQTRSAERMIARNTAFNALLDLREQDPELQRIIREVAGPRTAAQRGIPIGEAAMGGEKGLSGYRNGEFARYAVGKELAAVFDPATFERIPDAWRMWMSLYKQSITGRNPGFLAVNMGRDAYDAVVMATAAEGGPKNMARVLAEYGKAIPVAFDGMLHGEYRGTAAELRRTGMGMGGVKNDFKEAEKLIESYGREHALVVRSPGDLLRLGKDIVTNEWVAALNDRIEMVPRIARAELARQKGAGPIERMIAARDASIDFERGGELARAINQIVPFFNPVMQGGAQMVRTLRDHPRSAAATIGTAVGLPVIAAEVYNRSDPQRAKDYEDVPRYLRENGIVLMTGFEGKDAQGNRRPNFIWIPTGIFTPFAMAAREATGAVMGANDTRIKDPGDWKDLAVALAGSVSPIKTDIGQGLSQIIPPPVSTAAEVLSNRDFYRGATIASENRDQDAAPLSQALSAALDKIGVQLRPSQVDYIVRDLSGTFGQEALGASELVAGTAKDENRPFQTAPVAGGIVGRFVRDSIGQKLQNARDDMISPSVRQALRDAGMRDDQLSGVRGDINKLPLTRTEQAEYQRRFNEILNDEVSMLTELPKWEARPEEREAMLRDAATRARSRAAKMVLMDIDPGDRVDRKMKAAS